MKVVITAPSGVYLYGIGSREMGETFDDLPDEIAHSLIEQGVATAVEEPRSKARKEVKDES